MAINLQKGQKIDIGLSKITVGLGWVEKTVKLTTTFQSKLTINFGAN